MSNLCNFPCTSQDFTDINSLHTEITRPNSGTTGKRFVDFVFENQFFSNISIGQINKLNYTWWWNTALSSTDVIIFEIFNCTDAETYSRVSLTLQKICDAILPG